VVYAVPDLFQVLVLNEHAGTLAIASRIPVSIFPRREAKFSGAHNGARLVAKGVLALPLSVVSQARVREHVAA
jgi:hypothetical protein